MKFYWSAFFSLGCFFAIYGQEDSLWTYLHAQYANAAYQEVIAGVDQWVASDEYSDSLRRAELHHLRANAYYYTTDYLKSLADYDQAISWCPARAEGQNLRAMALFDRAFAEYALEEYIPAYQSTQAAEAIMSTLSAPNWDYLLSIYADLAFTARDLGFYEQAASYIRRGEALLKSRPVEWTVSPESPRKAVLFAYQRVLLYTHWNKEDLAKEALQKLAQLAVDTPFNAQEQLRYAEALNELGDMYLNFSQTYANPLPQAHAFLDQAFMALDTTLFPSHHWQFTFNRAKAYRLAQAFQRGLDLNDYLLRTCAADDHRLAFFWAQRALMLLPRQPDEARLAFRQMVAYIHQGKEALAPDFHNFQPSQELNHVGLLVETADEIWALPEVDEGLQALAADFYRLGLRQFQHCFQLGDYNAKLRTYYEHALGGILRTGQTMPAAELMPLLETVDHLESQLMWRRFADSRRLRQLKDSPEIYQQKLALRQAIVRARQLGQLDEVAALQDDIRQLGSRFSVARPGQSTFSVARLQAQLQPAELVLKYNQLGEDFYCFGISHDELWVRKLPALPTWQTDIDSLLIELRQLEPLQKRAARLANWLLPEDLHKYEDLYVVLDRTLVNIPFHLLTQDDRYLLQTHRLSYAPHLAFIYPEGVPRKWQANTQALVVAPTQPNQTIELSKRGVASPLFLAGALREAETVAQLTNGILNTGEAANKIDVLEHIPEARLLHIATHAVFDTVMPNMSYLQLTADERLFLEEVYGLSMRADLVVLSACHTAKTADYGWSLQAFYRAFVQAGVPSVMAGLWELPDQATSEIVETFYQELMAGQSKSTALQRAQLSYLDTHEGEQLAHPFFWAGLVLQGDVRAIYPAAKHPVKSWWMYWLFGLGLGGWWLMRKRYR